MKHDDEIWISGYFRNKKGKKRKSEYVSCHYRKKRVMEFNKK